VDIHLEAVIEQVWRCTWRLWLSECWYALGGRDGVSLEIHLEAVIEWVWRFTWKLSWCELGGHNHVYLKIHLEAVVERVWRCTWRPSSSEIGGVLGGSQSEGCSSGGRRKGSWDSIHRLTGNGGNVESAEQHGLPRNERLAGIERQSILGWCSTRCMQYSVYAVLGVNSWSWHGETESHDLSSCFQVMVELRTRKREIRWYGGNHHEKLRLKGSSCASEFIFPNMAVTSPNSACNYTHWQCSQPNQSSDSPDLSYLLVSSSSFLSPSPINLFLVHNSTIMAEHKVKSSLTISLCHDHELTQNTAYTEHNIHRVQYPPSTAYTDYIIHQAQHTTSTAYTSVSNGSSLLEGCRVRVGTGTEPLQWALPHENPDRCKWAGFTTKNPAFQHHKFGSNQVFEFWSYRDMISM